MGQEWVGPLPDPTRICSTKRKKLENPNENHLSPIVRMVTEWHWKAQLTQDRKWRVTIETKQQTINTTNRQEQPNIQKQTIFRGQQKTFKLIRYNGMTCYPTGQP